MGEFLREIRVVLMWLIPAIALAALWAVYFQLGPQKPETGDPVRIVEPEPMPNKPRDNEWVPQRYRHDVTT